MNIAYNECPACSSKDSALLPDISGGLKICKACDGIYGILREEDARQVIDPDAMLDNSDEMRYFDFLIIPINQLHRVYRLHGWYDIPTRRVVQWG